jgi:4-hydroxybenzoate polyprenyltransferase
VTATLVAVTGLAMRAPPSALLSLQLVLLMLPVQFAIGVVNDLADVADDAVSKPHKPLVRGAVSERRALVLAPVLAAIGLVAAATVGSTVLLLSLAGLGCGLAYDLGARRTPLSLLPWWGGVLVVPLLGFAAAGRLDARVWPAVPLTLLIALSLHCANAYPDIDGDRATGKRGLPVLLGRRGALLGTYAALTGALVLALTVFRPAAAGDLLFAACGLVLLTMAALTSARAPRPFAPLAIATAVLAVAWLAGVALS